MLPYLVYDKYQVSGAVIYVYLNDGSYFFLRKGACIDFYFDVNGYKKPNVQGRDLYTFTYCPKTAYSFRNAEITSYHPKSIDTREKALEACRNNPHTCSTLLFFDGWEFKDDYPYSI